MSTFVAASARALREEKSVNAVIENDEIVFKNFVDISVAVSSPKGLVVPVLRSADKMTFAQIEFEIGRYANKANDGTLSIDEMTGGTFTISNGGTFGSLSGTPIINPPQSAILGMHSIVHRPVCIGPENLIVARPMMNVALSGNTEGGITPGLTVLAGPSKHFKTSFALKMASSYLKNKKDSVLLLSLIHISEPTRPERIAYSRVGV